MKVKRLDENSNTLVKKALFGDITGKIKSFATLTAENPMSIETSPEINNKKTRELKSYLNAAHIRYIPLEGFFKGNSEHSFMIINISLKEAGYLAGKFGQESFFYGVTKSVGESRNTLANVTYYETSDNGKTYEDKGTVTGIKSVDELEDVFSRKGNYRYKFDIDFYEAYEALDSIKNEEALKRSLNESRTLKAQYIDRTKAYEDRSIKL